MWRLRTLLLPLLLCMICAVVYSHNTLQEQRNGLQDGGTYGLVDNLTYTYNGNQLTKISDSVEDPTYVGAFNFRDGADNSAEYTYDAVGNITSDKNKGITSITYNDINQPQKITFSDGKTTEYVYSYDGTKLQTVHKTQQPQTSATTTYCGNMIYENGALKQMLVDGGYVTFSGATPVYHFYIQDHLGNNRVVAKADGTVEQINHYYPYGGLMADICTGSDIQPYKYNGKELDRMHGLDTYDYGARQHNAATGRWDRMDQLAEENPEVSPYVYCMDNPAKFIDLDGKEPTLAEAVRIAAHVYGDKSNCILTGGWQVSKKNFGILLNTNNGLKSQVYERIINGKVVEYVYATAGTENDRDWKENVLQLLGTSEQYEESVANAKNLSSKLPDSELNYVGHSLGGGEAALNSLVTFGQGKGRKAFTFNAAGISLMTKVENHVLLNSERSIEAYMLITDPLNAIQNKFRPYLPSANGNIHYLLPQDIESIYNGHSIDNIMKNFK